jgi:hypothetical protein
MYVKVFTYLHVIDFQGGVLLLYFQGELFAIDFHGGVFVLHFNGCCFVGIRRNVFDLNAAQSSAECFTLMQFFSKKIILSDLLTIWH